MDPKNEILGADYSEHNIMQPSMVVGEAENTSFERNTEAQISPRPRFLQSEDKMAGIYKTYFTDDLATDRSKPPARDNPAYQPEEGV